MFVGLLGCARCQFQCVCKRSGLAPLNSFFLCRRYLDAIGHYKERYGKLPFDGDEKLIAALQEVGRVSGAQGQPHGQYVMIHQEEGIGAGREARAWRRHTHPLNFCLHSADAKIYCCCLFILTQMAVMPTLHQRNQGLGC